MYVQCLTRSHPHPLWPYQTLQLVLISRITDAQNVAESVSKASNEGEAEAQKSRPGTVRMQEARKVYHWSLPGKSTGDLPGFWREDVEVSPPDEVTLWQHMRPIRFPADFTTLGKAEEETRLHSYTSYLDSYDRGTALPGIEHIEAGDTEAAKVGDILLTHPLACWRQPSLDRVLVLVDSVDTSMDYVRGTVLGVPSGLSLREESNGRRVNAKDRDALLPLGALLDSPLFWGGDLRDRGLCASLTWLHTFGDAAIGANEIAPSVWSGGDLSMIAKFAQTSRGHRIQPIQGYLGWSSARLASELQSGLWIRVRCNTPEAAVALCLPPRDLTGKESFTDSPMKRQIGSPAIGWKAALQAVGLHGLVDFPRGKISDPLLERLLGLKKNDSLYLVGLEPKPVHGRRQSAYTRTHGTRIMSRRELFRHP